MARVTSKKDCKVVEQSSTLVAPLEKLTRYCIDNRPPKGYRHPRSSLKKIREILRASNDWSA